MSEIKVGDRVKCFGYSRGNIGYQGAIGVVVFVLSGCCTVNLSGVEAEFHPKQLRKIKKTTGLRRIWIPEPEVITCIEAPDRIVSAGISRYKVIDADVEFIEVPKKGNK